MLRVTYIYYFILYILTYIHIAVDPLYHIYVGIWVYKKDSKIKAKVNVNVPMCILIEIWNHMQIKTI